VPVKPIMSHLSLYLAAVMAAAACAPAATSSRGTPGGSLITAEDLERYPDEPLERILERKVPGIQAVRTPGGGLVLRVRGTSSWDGSERPPLYIINDLPVSAGPEGALPGINLLDIESIRVLPGTAAAIYGIDGANGVIIITLKRGGYEPQAGVGVTRGHGGSGR
jgi:TonB-dependent starch-binding outer membrane protein SusC